MDRYREALQRIATREPLRAWGPDMVDLPWGDPAFSERMLREHLNQDHELASRRLDTIDRQVPLLMEWLGLEAGMSLLDVTCGPGLVARAFARKGVSVTGVDIAPAAVRHAREITAGMGCSFIESDVRTMELPERAFDAGVYLYGQCEVARATVERHHILDIETGALRVIGATARALETAELKSILAGAGFPAVEFHPCWDGLDFDASADWLVAISR